MIRRYYVNSAVIKNASEAEIALAERLVDDYVGFQDKYIKLDHVGKVTDASGFDIFDDHQQTPLRVNDGYFTGAVLEMMSGEHAGETRRITGSIRVDLKITYDGNSLDELAVGDVYKIYQVAKFPRRRDVVHKDHVVYKSIPQAVREAVLSQIEYIQEQGLEYFASDSTDFDSESIGKYSYSRAGGEPQAAKIKMISPKTRTILQGIKNSGGRLIADNPTYL